MQNTAAFLTPLAIALASCATVPTAPPLADAHSVALGQRAYVDGPVVMPVEVLEDSRCPARVQCVWAGRVRVEMLWIRSDGIRIPFEVTLGERSPIADGSILLESVRPEKPVQESIRSEDYRFSLRFDGGL